MGKKLDDDIPDGHAFAATWGMHPDDDLLREHGFKVAERPPGGETVWQKNGVKFRKSEALNTIKARP